jgi:hypothetical protein
MQGNKSPAPPGFNRPKGRELNPRRLNKKKAEWYIHMLKSKVQAETLDTVNNLGISLKRTFIQHSM